MQRPVGEAEKWAVEKALERRVLSCVCVSCIVGGIECLAFSGPLWVVGGRRRLVDVLSCLGFGVASGVLLGAEHVVLGPGLFAARQPWRRALWTTSWLCSAGGTLGGIMGACVGATRSEAVAAVASGVLAAGSHCLGRCVSRGQRVASLSDVEVFEICRSRVPGALRCGLLGAAYARWRTEAPIATAVGVGVHAALAVSVAAGVASVAYFACVVEPLNFELVAGSRAVEALLSAAEIGDAGAADDAALRHAAQQSAAPAGGKGWYARASRDPFDGSAVDAAAPLWRREVDAQRAALWHIVADLEPAAKSSPLATPPPLSLASGGLVLGSSAKHPLASRLAKFQAVAALGSEDPRGTAASLILAGGAGDEASSRALRACLLLIDALSLRLEIAAREPAIARPDPAPTAPRLGTARYDSIAARLRASPFAQQFYFGDPAYLTAAAAAGKKRLEEDASPLEVCAVAAASRAVFSLVRSAEHRVPVALCSLLGARRALRDWRRTPEPRPDLVDLEACIDAAIDRFCVTFADILPRFAFPAPYVPDLERRIAALLGGGGGGGS